MAENRPPIRLVAADGTRLGVYADYTKNVKETMPAASQDWVDVSILYLGKSTTDFTTGHIYTCLPSGSGYMWADVTPLEGSSTNSNMVGSVSFSVPEGAGTTVLLTRELLGVVEDTPEYDIVKANGYNITTDTRLSRQWTVDGYLLTFIGGWEPGTYTAKTSIGSTYSRAELDARFGFILDELRAL